MGRDHAGVGDYYGAFDAQTIFDGISDALEIEIFRGDHTVWCKKCNAVVMMRDCPDSGDAYLFLSGTQVREMLAAGEALAAGVCAARSGRNTRGVLSARGCLARGGRECSATRLCGLKMEGETMKVVVVGGGAAGLAAAYTLRRLGLGIQVTLLEASPHVGGRMAGDEIDGFRIDTGAQMFILKDETVLWLCEELGVPLGPYGSDTGFYDKGKFHPIGRDQYLKSILAILSPAERSQLDKFADVLRAQPSVYDYSQFLSLDTEESITEYLEKNGGADLLEKVFQNSITARTLAQPEDVGVAFGMLLLRAFIFDTSLATLTPREGHRCFCGGSGSGL